MVILGRNLRDSLTGEDESRGTTSFQGHLPGLCGLIAIGRTNHHQVGHGPQRHKMLNGLMGGAILAQADAIVGEDKDHGQIHQRGHPQRPAHVIGKDQEGSTVGAGVMGGQPIHNRGHAMFPHAIMDVIATIVTLLDILGALRLGFVTAGQVSRASQ